LNQITADGELDFVNGLKVAKLALKFRESKRHRKRIVAFVGSPITVGDSRVIIHRKAVILQFSPVLFEIEKACAASCFRTSCLIAVGKRKLVHVLSAASLCGDLLGLFVRWTELSPASIVAT
jgi:hypothetical protein